MTSRRPENDERFATRSEVETMFNEYRNRVEEFKSNIMEIIALLRAEIMNRRPECNETPPNKRRRLVPPQTVPAPAAAPSTTPAPRTLTLADLASSYPLPRLGKMAKTTPSSLIETPPRQTSSKSGTVPAMIVVTPPSPSTRSKGERSPPYPRTTTAEMQNKFLTVPNIRAKRQLVFE